MYQFQRSMRAWTMSHPSSPTIAPIPTSLPNSVTPVTIAVNLPARILRDDNGVIWADVPALPGCVAGGAELDEVLANLREAAEGWLLAKNDIETRGWPEG
jgi:predicted RNase H-like HicB family nuclease